MDSLDAFAGGKLAALEAKSLKRTLVPTGRTDGVHVERGGKTLISFSCNDYLGLSHHPRVKAAAADALARWGTGSGASRLVTGDNPLIEDLETRLARLKGAEAACVFGSGYLANTGIIPTLTGEGDLILVDELAHACLWAGSQLSPADVVMFRHNDVDHLAELLAETRAAYRHVLVVTDGVFSMDGDLAPLDRMVPLCAAHDAWLMTDDAHGVGVVGGGRGSSYAFEATAKPPLQMGTLSKAIGGYGGYLCANKPVIDFIKTRARTVVYSTGLPPANAAAAIAALDLIESDSVLVGEPVRKARLFTAALGLPPAESPIVPVLFGPAEAALTAMRALEAMGFMVVAIRPPTVPAGTARLRFTFSALHSDADVLRLADAVRALLAKAAA
ncbi:8-amino-7-oxononanoate synthase [Caulobacter mirabilis]|uniref:8-amino-7-ketopelargonate synthase n=1 Tax=Caulobacter mirabilis TaxID=69666 RepID=A0A2D2AVM5_9CAUL|nr:8-amino-7-oxononanoate synthase [Caulobacter mirabilis]ATQ42054.1 8-amino-7-oxononanoate synthase [Caulobacter mirabilis]